MAWSRSSRFPRNRPNRMKILVASWGRHGCLNEAIAQCREKHTEVQKKWPTALVVVIPVIWRDDFAPVLEQHLVFRLKPYLANRA